jgi:hypothetical protein
MIGPGATQREIWERNKRRKQNQMSNWYHNKWFGAFIVISLVFLVLIPGGGYNFLINNFNSLSSASVVRSPVAPGVNAIAWCAATQTYLPINQPTNNACQNVAQTLSLTPVKYIGVGGPTPYGLKNFEATTGLACKIFQYTSTGWTPIETDQSTSAGVCTTTGSFYPGATVAAVICEDDTSNCLPADYTATQSVAQCLLPPPTAPASCPQPSWTPGANGIGNVPFWVPSGSTTIQYNYNLAVITLIGDDPNGLNSATGNTLYWTWQNGTRVSAADLCSVSGTAGCALPKASSLGRFQLQLSTLMTGTLPANPYSIGYSSFTPVDPTQQTGASARGPLNYVIQIEVKATVHSDMCIFQNGGLFANSNQFSSPTIIAKGGSATDTLYDYVVSDSAITKSTDPSGVPINAGTLAGTLQVDCNQVYSGSGDTVTITATQYAYFSLAWAKAYAGNSINPEASTTGPTAFALSILT